MNSQILTHCNLLENRAPVDFFSAKTRTIGIAQLTHHEVCGGGRNPVIEVQAIFAPTADWVVS